MTDAARLTVTRLAPGLWRWTAPHPEWTPEKDKPGGWDRMVAATYCEPPAGESGPATLIDPIVPPSGTPEEATFWTALDRDLRRTDRPVRIVIANGYHARSAREIAGRSASRGVVEVLAHAEAAGRLGFEPTGRFRDEVMLPGGVELIPVEALDAGETAVFLRHHRALVFADAVLGAGGGRLAVAPRSWAAEGEAAGARYGARFRPSLARLLDRDPVMVLPSHGEPALSSGRAALAAALDGPAWGEPPAAS